MTSNSNKEPQGQLAIRVVAMPADSNPNGDIFGGWVLSHMDIAGMSLAKEHTKNRVTTVAIEAMSFIAPVHVGDFICCYVDLVKKGRTSISIKVETWAVDAGRENRRQVTEGILTYVSIDDEGRPTPL